jgi:hypothetical protein
MDKKYHKKRLYITLYPEEIKRLKELAKCKDCTLSLSEAIGRLIRNYKGDNIRYEF